MHKLIMDLRNFLKVLSLSLYSMIYPVSSNYSMLSFYEDKLKRIAAISTFSKSAEDVGLL